MTDSLVPDSSSNPAALLSASAVERAKAGDAAAFEALIDCYQRKVLSTAFRLLGNREDAQDAAQEVFLRVHKYLRGFRSDQDFAAWLYRIIVNVCRDHIRKREAGTLEALASGEDVEANAIKSQQHAMIAEALDTLSTKERAALVLRDFEGLSTVEVARVLGSSQTTVRTQICSARAKIKQYRDRVLKRTRRG
jgi:RNA polymerase sigma-70 factor (ECF subfamily)